MDKSRKRMVIGFFTTAIILWLVGAVAQPLITNYTTPQQRADNAMLGGIPFILIFIGIILAFIGSIALLAGLLNHHISAAVHTPIMNILIAGILLGIFGLFQPFFFQLYKIGFNVLLISTIGYIVWSHIIPKQARRE
jgi:hypothetical protein